MSSRRVTLTTKVIVLIIIVAMLDGMQLSPVILVFFSGVALVVWLLTRRAHTRDVERIFDFYVAADAILREEERRWYGFEIAEVIEHGEIMLEIMPDPPPLNYFALGALYYRLGNHHATVEYLSRVTEDEAYLEAHQTAPSPQLRRYVTALRKIEVHPATAPHVLGAIRSLERTRQRSAEKMLLESRGWLDGEQCSLRAREQVSDVKETSAEMTFAPSLPLSAISARPPISKVLSDVYQDETGASN
jgi:hypothetical protein